MVHHLLPIRHPRPAPEAPVLLQDRAQPDVQAQDVSYRSEAFAEDLFSDSVPGVLRLSPTAGSLLTAVPLLVAVSSALVSLLA